MLHLQQAVRLDMFVYFTLNSVLWPQTPPHQKIGQKTSTEYLSLLPSRKPTIRTRATRNLLPVGSSCLVEPLLWMQIILLVFHLFKHDGTVHLRVKGHWRIVHQANNGYSLRGRDSASCGSKRQRRVSTHWFLFSRRNFAEKLILI